MTGIRFTRTALVFLLATWLGGCAAGPTISSQPPSRDIIVDGDMVEWIDLLHEVADTRLRVGIQHDNDFVYLAVLSTQRNTVQQIASGGLTIWFDSTAGQQKGLGVRYPVGVSNLPPRPASNEVDRLERLRETSGQIDLYFETGKPLRRPTAASPGLLAASGFEFGAFTLELRIPRNALRNDVMSMPVSETGRVWIGLETGGGRDRTPEQEDRDDMGARGRTGGIGAVGRDFGGQSGGPSGMYLGPIDVWIEAKL